MALASTNPAQGRRLAVGLLVVTVLAGIAAIAIPVWMLHRHYDAALAENADKLER